MWFVDCTRSVDLVEWQPCITRISLDDVAILASHKPEFKGLLYLIMR